MSTSPDLPPQFKTGNPLVDAALSRLHAANDSRFRDLEDAMLVHSTLEASAARRIKEHAELIAEATQRHNDAQRSHDEWMLHIQSKLDAITDILMRREGGAEAR